jgi:hypothetical protein
MANGARSDVTSVWRNQPRESVEISLEDIRRKAQKFQRRILWRNLREYAATVTVIASFGYVFWWASPAPLIRAGCGLLMAGTLFAMYALHRKGSARTVPAEMLFRTCVEFHREELRRQRDLARSAWTWYVLPFVPGLAVFLLGDFLKTMQMPNAPAHRGVIETVFALAAAGCALVFVGVAKLNQWSARKIQRQIDALDAMGKEP